MDVTVAWIGSRLTRYGYGIDLLWRLKIQMNFTEGINRKILLALGAAAVIAVMTGFWLWSQEPKYRVLFSNYSDKDGGAIVTVLEQMNVPYKISEGGGAIMVPSDQVHQARLKLATMGLPKGGNVGFELLENQKFGSSQFLEQVNYQRALEGELEKSIQAISVVDNARVHLALPKPGVFVRDQQRATASVLVKLQAGRNLSERQVSAITHLVSSSVPNLPNTNVSVVDQSGNLLSDKASNKDRGYVDPSQTKYIEDLQKNIAARVEAIIVPIVGFNNVHAQASAEVDFSNLEQAEEMYKPNKNAEQAVIRSMQSNESTTAAGAGETAAGVPGALSNQPPPNGTAPINNEAAAGNTAAGVNPKNVSTTVNYEVDKTVRYTQKTMGGIKRLTVAVVINDKQELDKAGKIISRPLSDEETAKITDLAKSAMGFSEARGDQLSVVNSSFAPIKVEEIGEVPVWKNTAYIEMAKDAGRLLLGLIGVFMLYTRALKPLVAKLLAPPERVLSAAAEANQFENDGAPTTQVMQIPQRGYEQNLEHAKGIAKENPKMVANVVTSWVSGNG